MSTAMNDLIDDFENEPRHHEWLITYTGKTWHTMAIWPPLTLREALARWNATDALPTGERVEL